MKYAEAFQDTIYNERVNTIQKLQIDEQTFNDNLKEIQQSVYHISNELGFYENFKYS